MLCLLPGAWFISWLISSEGYYIWPIQGDLLNFLQPRCLTLELVLGKCTIGILFVFVGVFLGGRCWLVGFTNCNIVSAFSILGIFKYMTPLRGGRCTVPPHVHQHAPWPHPHPHHGPSPTPSPSSLDRMTFKRGKLALIFPGLKNAFSGPHTPFSPIPWPFALLEDRQSFSRSGPACILHMLISQWLPTPIRSSFCPHHYAKISVIIVTISKLPRPEAPFLSLSQPSCQQCWESTKLSPFSKHSPHWPSQTYQPFYISFWPLFRLHLLFTL